MIEKTVEVSAARRANETRARVSISFPNVPFGSSGNDSNVKCPQELSAKIVQIMAE